MAPATLGARRPARASTVEILRWPAQADRRADLLGHGRAVLWMLEPGELPPEVGDREDWARTTDGERDVLARLDRLAALGPAPVRLLPGEVAVRDGLLLYAGCRLPVPPAEAVILDRLGATPDRVVARGDLAVIAGGGHPANPSSLATRVARLRDRIGPVGLAIHTVRGRGYLLTTAGRPGGPSWPG